MNLVIVIPARGGSKGIPRKNIAPLSGKPLIAYTIDGAREASVADGGIFVSTDSKEIAEAAGRLGVEIIDRPKEISYDRASTESALIHAVEAIRTRTGSVPAHILTLPPTSPLRKPNTIRSFVSRYFQVSDQYDAMISLTQTLGDYWIKDSAGEFKRLFPDAPRRRQDRQPLYEENSALYITRTEALLETQSILGRKCTGYVIDELEAIDINEPADLSWAEFVIKNLL